MSIKITQNKNHNDKLVNNFVLFCDESFKIGNLGKLDIGKQSDLINKTIKSNKSEDVDFLLFNINSTQKVVLIKIKKTIISR